MSEKQVTFTVLHSAGEDINGVNVRPYETFKAAMTPEYKDKVKKGLLAEGTKSHAEINNPASTRSIKKSSRRK